MNEILEFNSPRYGPVRVYLDKNNWVTVYCRVDEVNWKHFRRDDYNPDPEKRKDWEETEIDWRGYILGARSLRFDFKLEPDDEVTKKSIEALITKAYNDDDLPYLHVERIAQPPEWKEMSDADLWEVERELHRRKGDLEVELREVRRLYDRIWSYGDSKFDWASKL